MRAVVVLLAAVILASCGVGEDVAVPTATADCDAPEFPQVQFGSHLIGDAEPPVPYSSTPPSSGWHASGALDIGVYPATDALSEPQQVSVLEAGAVVVTHDGLGEDDTAALDLGALDTFVTAYAVEDPFVPGTDRTPGPVRTP